MPGWKTKNNITEWKGTIQSDFLGTAGRTPTEELDLVNKNYVDSQIRGAIDLFFTNNASDIGTYKDMETDVVTAAQEQITQAITGNSTTLIASFASILNEAEIDALTILEAGIYSVHIHAETNFAIGMTFYFEFYHRTAGGTETLLGTSHDSGTLTTSDTEYDLHAAIEDDKAFVSGDRIVVKIYGRNGGAAAKNVTITMEGNTLSRVEFPGFLPPSFVGAHTIVSHSDTTATGAELDTLTGGGDTTLHDHDGISENTTHRQDNSQAHTDYLLNNADDTSNSKVTIASGAITGDITSVDTAYVPMTLFNTDDTPPTASNFPKGTIYIKYTA